jgi:AraC-like DNA-binding protein
MTADASPEPFPTFHGDFPSTAVMAMAMRGVDVAIPPAGPTDPAERSMLARTAVDGLNIMVGRFGQGIPQALVTRREHTFLFPTDPSAVRRVSGRILERGHLFHLRPESQTAASSPPGTPWAFGIVTAPLGRLAEAGRAVTGQEALDLLDDDRMFLPPARAMGRLVGLMQAVVRVTRDTPWVLGAPEPATALAGSVTDALLACLTEGRMRPERAALVRRRQVVARFETVLRERPEEMLSLSAICGAVGVAERTLNLACQDFLGQGAVQYARGRRLDLVRLTLLASDPGEARVTGVAMQYGFWELGRFAQAYRRRFGERPSETLRAGPGAADRG